MAFRNFGTYHNATGMNVHSRENLRSLILQSYFRIRNSASTSGAGAGSKIA